MALASQLKSPSDRQLYSRKQTGHAVPQIHGASMLWLTMLLQRFVIDL